MDEQMQTSVTKLTGQRVTIVVTALITTIIVAGLMYLIMRSDKNPETMPSPTTTPTSLTTTDAPSIVYEALEMARAKIDAVLKKAQLGQTFDQTMLDDLNIAKDDLDQALAATDVASLVYIPMDMARAKIDAVLRKAQLGQTFDQTMLDDLNIAKDDLDQALVTTDRGQIRAPSDRN